MKRAPVKNRLALFLDRDGNVAGVDDDARSFASIEMLEEGQDDTVPVAFDGEDIGELVSLLDELGATDVVAAWFEDEGFGSFEGEGFALWLVPSETSAREAIQQWHENTLTQAEKGIEVVRKGHVLHAPAIEKRPRGTE
ncbi:MAG: hypothetical protein M5U25_15710 [Planctomycetota bacterium]|nr:hypothetical protein [Planctomycetota bacterium]